jgi:hypothetical protein
MTVVYGVKARDQLLRAGDKRLAIASDEHVLGERPSVSDEFELLEFTHMVTLFARDQSLLAAVVAEQGLTLDDSEKRWRRKILEQLELLRVARNTVSHKPYTEVTYEVASEGLANAKSVLTKLGLVTAADNVLEAAAGLAGSPKSVIRSRRRTSSGRAVVVTIVVFAVLWFVCRRAPSTERTAAPPGGASRAASADSPSPAGSDAVAPVMSAANPATGPQGLCADLEVPSGATPATLADIRAGCVRCRSSACPVDEPGRAADLASAKLRVGLAGAWNSRGEPIDRGLTICVRPEVGNEICSSAVALDHHVQFGPRPARVTGEDLYAPGLRVSIRKYGRISVSSARRSATPVVGSHLCGGLVLDLAASDQGVAFAPAHGFDVASVLLCLEPDIASPDAGSPAGK